MSALSNRVAVAAAVACACAFAAPASAQLLTQKALSAAMALTIAQTAMRPARPTATRYP